MMQIHFLLLSTNENSKRAECYSIYLFFICVQCARSRVGFYQRISKHSYYLFQMASTKEIME